MKILIIGPGRIDNKLLVRAAKKRGHQVKLVAINELVFILKDKQLKICYNRRDVSEYDICLVRGIFPWVSQAETLAKYMVRHGKKVVDRELATKVYAIDKVFTQAALNYHGLPCIDTYYFPDLQQYKKIRIKFEYPVMLKDLHGMKCRNIFIIKNKTELERKLREIELDHFFIQKLIHTDFHYRIMVVGKKILGAMKHYSFEFCHKNELVTGKARTAFPADLTPQLKKIALKTVKAANVDIAGIDLLFDEAGEPYIIEVNRAPNFTRFMEVTKIDVPKEIIKYLETVKK